MRNYTLQNHPRIVITKDVHFCSQLVKTTGRSKMNLPIGLSWSNVLKVSNIEHFRGWQTLHYVVVKTKELTPKQILSLPCTTCGASDRGGL